MGIKVSSTLYDWAIKRSGRGRKALTKKYPKLGEWQAGTKKPTLTQLENFAKYTNTPIGSFFDSEPPDETLPISDFRTFENKEIPPINANVLDAIYDCQLKQAWYEEYCLAHSEDKNTFVGSLTLSNSAEEAATAITKRFFSKKEYYSTWNIAFTKRKEHIEDAGILVMTSGCALDNTNRALNVEEFRGFALSNAYAPLIFINAKDTIAARNFTLIHELAHIALGESGISNDGYNHHIERWCNTVAGEVLVPKAELTEYYKRESAMNTDVQQTLATLAKKHKVSTLVILRRLKDTQLLQLSNEEYAHIEKEERNRALEMLAQQNKSKGGDYYKSKSAKLSKRFFKALAVSTLEGHTLYRDAMHLVNVKTMKTFQSLIERIRKAPS